MRDKAKLMQLLHGATVVVLLAAEHRDDVTPITKYYDVNVGGMQNVLAAMEANDVKHIVFTSSVAVYGLNKENPNEEHLKDPFNHYGKVSGWRKWNLKNGIGLIPIGISIFYGLQLFLEKGTGGMFIIC